MTDYKALCAELLQSVEESDDYILAVETTVDLVIRTRAALAAESEPPDTGEVPKLREAPAAWLYRGDPDFDGTTWLVNWRVTTDERVARFNAQPDKPVPLFRHPIALAAPEPPADGEVADPVIPGEYRGFNAIAYRNGFHAGHKHALTRAALAKPELPTNEELISPIMWMLDECVYDNDKGEIAQSLRELIARWGQ